MQPTTLRIAPGEFVAVVGPSGSGKTTLLSMLGGMLAPTSGQVRLDGQSRCTTRRRAQRAQMRLRKIGFVFQTFNLVPYLSALENVQVPLMLRARQCRANQEQRVRGVARSASGWKSGCIISRAN